MVFLRYYFEGTEKHRIKLTPHETSKVGCAILYLRTYKSTISKMKNNVVRIEKGCSGDRQSGSTRVLQFCWTGTAE